MIYVYLVAERSQLAGIIPHLMNIPSRELFAASSIPLVLAVLSKGESYGYDIIRQVREASGGELLFSDGTLYPVLRKLEERGLVSSEWKIGENEKRRRYYVLTAKGVDQFSQEKAAWTFMNNLIEQLWKPGLTTLA